MSEQIIPANRSIIVACDVQPHYLLPIVNQTNEIKGIGGYKIGFEVALGFGLKIATDIVKSNAPDGRNIVIYDHQKAGNDIESLGENFAQVASSSGVDAVILFPSRNPKVAERWIKEAQDRQLGVIVGAEMTSADDLESGGGYLANNIYLRMFDHAAENSVEHFAVPANKSDKVDSYRRFFERRLGDGGFTFYGIGIGKQGGSIKEFSRFSPPRRHAVIGRAIVDAADPTSEAIKFAKEMQAV